MFSGAGIGGVVTFKNGKIDYDCLEKLIEIQIEKGINGLVPCGSTGESATMSVKEHEEVIKFTVDKVNKRVPVIAGTGSNNTAEAIELTKYAADVGVDGALLISPYYNKPTQEGLYHHYKTINDQVDLPVIIYNIPGRSIVDISNETIARLSELKNIVGVKDATADLARPLDLRHLIGDKFCQLSGEDATTTAFLAQGGHGCISVTSNIAPTLCAKMHHAWQDGDIATMNKCRDALAPVHSAMFCESSPAPVKYAASRLGLCRDVVRQPLMKASDNARTLVDNALEFSGLLGDKTPKVVSG